MRKKQPIKKSNLKKSKTGQLQAKASPFLIAGIGASAGGLEAVQELFGSIPPNLGIAFVLIQHLDPQHQSHTPEILARATKMPVHEVKDGMKVEADNVYVIPEAARMVILDGTLRLTARVHPRGRPSVIDQFFFSLARVRKNRSIGVILSGTGSDGAQGLLEIKSAGGVTFAQDETAKYNSMPNAAIATGAVDFTLSPSSMAKEFERISRGVGGEGSISEKDSAPIADDKNTQESIAAILQMLHKSTGVNFTSYKKGTIHRRISRRMHLRKTNRLEKYLECLRDDPSELATLHQDLLINVTSFFRDPEVFEALKKDVFPKVVKDKPLNSPIRIWVPGCASGEEAYTIAISLLEFLGDNQANRSVQIFCTDLSEGCLEKARLGEFSEAALAEVSSERRRRFFVAVTGGFQICKAIREICIFAKHDLTRDPPFSQMDLISCRNLLIYLEGNLQKRVISLFHYALKPNGFLLLGISENIGPFGELFGVVDSKRRLFSKKLAPGHPHYDFGAGRSGDLKATIVAAKRNEAEKLLFDLTREVDRTLAKGLGPNCVVINEEMEIVQVRGRTGAYLEPTPEKAGELSHNLLKMARPGLLSDLRGAIQKAKKESISVRRDDVRIKSDGGSIYVSIQVLPVAMTESDASYFIVVFGETSHSLSATSKQRSARRKFAPESSSSRIERLEKELLDAQEYLQSLLEREQAGNEELKSANEEVLSSNEELQSTNEELETAKEELQSVNEELTTLNDELQSRNHQLHVVANDLSNLVASVRIPVLLVTRELRLRKITPGIEKLVNILPSDIGRPLSDFKTNIDVPNLIPLIHNVIDNVTPEEREVRTSDGTWFSMWIRPYLTSDNKIDGAIISLSDIDSIKRARDYAEAVIETIREPLLVLDSTLHVRAANRSFYDTFHVSKLETEGQLIYRLGDNQWDIPALRRLLEEILPKKNELTDFEVTADFPSIGPKIMLLNSRRIVQGNDVPELILLAIEDITARKHSGDSLLRTNIELEQFAYVASHDLQEPLRMVSSYMELLTIEYKGKLLDKNAEKYIEIAMAGAKRMKGLVQDLLAFARTGREELKYESTDCAAVLDRVLKDLSESIKESHAEITQDSLPTILASDSLIGQVFQNLISNAIKYRGPSVPKIHISAKENPRDWEFSVEDNGIGIEGEYLDKIFLIFQRLHGRDKFEGTGIGLAMSKKIVERYGGRIWAKSQPGRGSTFCFTIPRRDSSFKEIST